jgi:hypothetical protein
MSNDPLAGGIFLEIRTTYLGRTARLAAIAAALAMTSCGDPGFTEEAVSSDGSGEPVATAAEELGTTTTLPNGCKFICVPKLGCGTVCPPPPPPPPPPRGSLVPNFYITHVVYAPPGRSSSIEYSNSTSVGSTTSVAKGFKIEGTVTAEASASVLSDSGVKISVSKSGSSTKTDAVDISLKYSSGYKKLGQSDQIDHNYDEIWFLVRPKLDFTVLPGPTPAQDEVRWKFGAQDGVNHGIPYFVYAGELNNAMQMPAHVKRDLDYWGITPDMYPTLLAANPLFTGTTPNMTMNPERFKLLGTYPFRAPRMQDDQPSIQTFMVEHDTKNTSTKAFDFDCSVGLTVTTGFDFGLVKSKLSVEGKWTWTNSSTYSNSTGTGSMDALSVGQPQFGYDGPSLLRVYMDQVFKTYAFTLDYPQGETNLSEGRWGWQSSDLPGYNAGAMKATDGNTSGNFWDGSVTHTDRGFTGWGEATWPGQYWVVDLGSERVVNSVKIFNRTDCCSERLSHYNVLAWDMAKQTYQVVSDHSGDVTTGVPFFHHTFPMVRTQWVMIAKTNDDYLSLAEVQVLGF